ncbi:MAG: hypothetical protein IT324_14795 [Anaerolineae bacterium]|nr:hypothetical protein [Anaerolineae bacterium]
MINQRDTHIASEQWRLSHTVPDAAQRHREEFLQERRTRRWLWVTWVLAWMGYWLSTLGKHLQSHADDCPDGIPALQPCDQAPH